MYDWQLLSMRVDTNNVKFNFGSKLGFGKMFELICGTAVNAVDLAKRIQ